MNAKEVGNTVTMLVQAIGGFVHVETNHGVTREGRLTGWEYTTIKVNNVDVKLPRTLELNGDPQDTINLADIVKIDVD